MCYSQGFALCLLKEYIDLIILQLSSNKWQKNAKGIDSFQQGKSKSGLFWSKRELQAPADSWHTCRSGF